MMAWLLGDMLAKLPDDCLVVMHGLFIEGYSGREMAKKLYVHESRVSQIKKKAMRLLRKRAR